MTITLDREQSEVLQETLTSALAQLRNESARTDSHDFRVQLHRRERVIEAMLGIVADQAQVMQ